MVEHFPGTPGPEFESHQHTLLIMCGSIKERKPVLLTLLFLVVVFPLLRNGSSPYSKAKFQVVCPVTEPFKNTTNKEVKGIAGNKHHGVFED